MNWNDVAAAAGPLLLKSAPTIGSLLGGLLPIPGGSLLGSEAGSLLANAFGVPNTPEEVNNAIQTDPNAEAKIAAAESEAAAKWPALAAMAKEQTEQLKVQTADTEAARTFGLDLVKAGSPIQWAPVLISAIVIIGFQIISYLAIERPVGSDRDIIMFLLGAWSTAFMAAINYWLGSSKGSKDKDDVIGQALSQKSVVESAVQKPLQKVTKGK